MSRSRRPKTALLYTGQSSISRHTNPEGAPRPWTSNAAAGGSVSSARGEPGGSSVASQASVR